jgi:hypothetical protein
MKFSFFVFVMSLICAGKTLAQEQEIKVPFYIYKTAEDFFNNKKMYRGDWTGSSGDEIRFRIPGSDKKYKVNLSDSISSYFAYQTFSIFVRLDEKQKSYSLYGGGGPQAFCVMGGTSANYDQDRYVIELFWKDWFEIYYYDLINNVLIGNKIEDLLKLKPKLLEKYLLEKSESDKKAWKRNKIPTEMKYLKLYNSEK